jgi:type IV secretory pathway VirJ component
MKIILPAFLPALLSFTLLLPADTLPVKEWSSSSAAPVVLYITGDGGINSFSTDLCNALQQGGYSVTAVNAKSYFWDKKTPEQTVADIKNYLAPRFSKRINQQLVLVGYSFGADVMPFIVNKLPDELKSRLMSVVLLSPSTSTDFEIHLWDMFGGSKKRSMDVVAEINRMGTIKTTTIFGADEDDFPVKNITLKNYSNLYLPGGHHFGGNSVELAKIMIGRFK